MSAQLLLLKAREKEREGERERVYVVALVVLVVIAACACNLINLMNICRRQLLLFQLRLEAWKIDFNALNVKVSAFR